MRDLRNPAIRVAAMGAPPAYVAPRTCTIVDEGVANRDTKKRAAPLSGYADTAAYVLIAEPGAGKTTTFKTETARQRAVYVTVRNFLRLEEDGVARCNAVP